MIYPSIMDLTRGKFNRYTLVIATAKCARLVTDEYVKQREYADKLIANKETDKSIVSLIKREYRDEKAVKNAINRLYNGEFKVVECTEDSENKNDKPLRKYEIASTPRYNVDELPLDMDDEELDDMDEEEYIEENDDEDIGMDEEYGSDLGIENPDDLEI